MSAESVTAVCAVVIAVASLVVTVYQTHAMRQHNRHSVRPMIQLRHSWYEGRTAGIRLVNSGLGPAVVVDSTLTVDGTVIGAWNKSNADRIRAHLSVRPHAVTFDHGQVLATDFDQYLLSVADFNRSEHAEIEDLITRRLTLTIRYESLYGGEHYTAALRPVP
ncbi:hypothetical protein ACH4FX_13740 [Streptomyces sp. NPDC018019]|uniref:hypothetical protein n=1 Tax=Streptomyces sp. NPDC018019 TaxID=3365030 RepID=UPI0037BC369E